MDETLREVIEHYVREGFQLSTLSPGGSATLVRGGEQLRLRLNGRWVLFDQSPAAAPEELQRARGGGWLAFVLAAAAASGAAGLVLIGFALLLDDEARPPATVATATTTATAAPTLAPTTTPGATATASPTATPPPTASPSPSAVPSPTPRPPVTRLVASDQRLGPDARRIVVDEVTHDAPFYVVVYAGDAGALGPPLAASALLAAGTHAEVVVPLPRAALDGEQLWLALHAERNGNASFDGPSIDRALMDAVSGSRGPQGEVAARIEVLLGPPAPPLSGNAGAMVALDPGARRFAAALVALSLALAFGTRALTAPRTHT